MADDIAVNGFPVPLRPSVAGVWRITSSGGLTGTAGPATDLFIDPAGDPPALSAPRLTAAVPDGEWQFAAEVDVDFVSTYDAGVLLLWTGERTWAKLCFEYSPQRRPMVVSVVTRGVSDDANAFTVEGSSVWLRISRRGGAYAFHAATDGAFWRLIRLFSLGDEPAEVGFEVQSPIGAGCQATFEGISYRAQRLLELRDGT